MQRRDVVDHALQRRALLRELFSGGLFASTTPDDVCDASPYLKRAAKALGTVTQRSCPVCRKELLWEVAWVYGTSLGASSGSARTLAQVRELADTRAEFAVYEVEVCHGCGWNHLVRSWRTGRVGAVSARRARTSG